MTNSRTGASTPIVRVGGISAMQKVAADMIRIDQRQGGSTADAVTDMAPDEAAERAHEERDGEQREGQEQGRRAVDSGKNTVEMVVAR